MRTTYAVKRRTGNRHDIRQSRRNEVRTGVGRRSVEVVGQRNRFRRLRRILLTERQLDRAGRRQRRDLAGLVGHATEHIQSGRRIHQRRVGVESERAGTGIVSVVVVVTENEEAASLDSQIGDLTGRLETALLEHVVHRGYLHPQSELDRVGTAGDG